jgi:hypothetical protein
LAVTTLPQPRMSSTPMQGRPGCVLVGYIQCRVSTADWNLYNTKPPTQATYAELEKAYLMLSLRHQELLAEIEQRNESLGEKILECMRLIHELSLLHQEDDHIRLQQDVLANSADRTGRPLNPYDIHFRPMDFIHAYSPGPTGRRRPPHANTRSILLRQLGRAFYRDPSLSSNSFNAAWQSVSSS